MSVIDLEYFTIDSRMVNQHQTFSTVFQLFLIPYGEALK